MPINFTSFNSLEDSTKFCFFASEVEFLSLCFDSKNPEFGTFWDNFLKF